MININNISDGEVSAPIIYIVEFLVLADFTLEMRLMSTVYQISKYQCLVYIS